MLFRSEVFDPNFEVTVEEAQQINKRKKFIVGDEIEVPIDPCLLYTSDVYKRQMQEYCKVPNLHGFHHRYNCLCCRSKGKKIQRLSLSAVSYTHLDVYKRQALPRARICRSSYSV